MTVFNFAGQAEQIISNGNDGNFNADVQVSLFNNGTLTSAFGFLDGVRVMAFPIPVGDSLTSDTINLNSTFNPGDGPAWRAGIIWDEQTQTNFGVPGQQNISWEQLYGSNRYGLPANSQLEAYEIINGSSGDDIVKLDYNAANGGVAYTWNITLNLGEGRDLGITGEGNDLIFGGSENTDLGDGLWGMGGNDTIYGGYNQFGSGADDLYGFAGNDTIYGHNDGDVYYGDQGNDTIYAAGWEGTIAFGGNASEIGNSVTMWGGDGDDTIFGSVANGAVQVYYGGAPSPYWVDAKFTGGATNADTGLNDVVSYFGATTGVTLDLQVGTIVENWPGGQVPNSGSFTLTVGGGSGGAANGDTFYGIEHVVGSNVAGDNITGSASANRLDGGGGDDILSGDTGNDTLIGGGGNDSLSGNADNDTIFGGSGADTIGGGGGGDTMSGGALGEGNWLIYSNSEAVSVDLGANTATGLTVNSQANGDVISNFDNLIGGAQNDALTGGAGVNTIYGGGGVDTIHGGGGADSLAGGGEGDWLSYAASVAGVSVNLNNAGQSGGDAEGDFISGFTHLIGSGADDSLTGTSAVNTIFGGTGADTIEGGAGGDSLAGGGNLDWLSYAGSAAGVSVTLSNNSVTGGDATGDSISGFANAIGSASGDVLVGFNGANTLFGGGGNDTVRGSGGADSLDGGAGTEDLVSYEGSAQGVTVVLANVGAQSGGDAQGDILANFENLLGSGLADSLTGNALANTIYGGVGNDAVDGLAGDDTLYGGADSDFVIYGNSGSAVNVVLASNTATGGLGNDRLFEIEHVSGSNFNDTLTGDGIANSLVGNAGIDTLSGGLGADSLFGGNDDDLVFLTNDSTSGPGSTNISGWDGETGSGPISVGVAAGAGLSSDQVFGGSGIDTINMQSLGGGVSSIYSAPNSSISTNFLAGVEIIIAGAAADVINLTFIQGGTRVAYTENVTVESGFGNDVVFAGSGNDLVVGGVRSGAGNANNIDTLYGGAGNDTIFGDDQASAASGGGDFLFGSAGNDIVNAGLGNDSAYGGTGVDSLFGEAGNDFLFDLDGGNLFGGAGGDLLVMSGSGEANYTISGGLNDGTDGADSVFTSGTYGLVTSSLGEGNDKFISSSTNSGTAQVDRVNAENGNDVVSTWHGNDTVDGGSGNDVIWGGAGSDTIYGGIGTDYLYGGAGNSDVMVGGAGIDYYYWSRTDGSDMIDDNDPGALPGTGAHINALIVFPDFDNTETIAGSDSLRTGTGVFETDHNLYDNAGGDDMVQLVDIGGGMMELRILNGAGAGSVMTFEQDDISNIVLWNNDATPGTPVITQYVWNEAAQQYIYTV